MPRSSSLGQITEGFRFDIQFVCIEEWARVNQSPKVILPQRSVAPLRVFLFSECYLRLCNNMFGSKLFTALLKHQSGRQG